MKDKKKIIIIGAAILIVAVIAAVVFYFITKSDKNEPPTLKETVESRITAYETDFRDSLASMSDQEAVARYLSTWGENKGIDVKTDKYNNVIYSINATEGYEDKAPAVIVCGYDYTCMDTYINSIVSALTIAKNDQPHGEYKIIFISQEKGSMSGAENLSSKYFKDGCEIFYLGNSSSSRVANITGGYDEFRFSRKLATDTPQYTKTYTVSISGLPSESFGTESVSQPNPVKILGDQLATLKSGSIWFELASFTGGTDASATPASAQMTLVVSQDISSKFESKMEKAIEKFYDKYQEDYPDVQYTCTPAETPARVFTTDATDAIVSLMYTAMNGVHYKDDNGDVASLTNIGYISATEKGFIMDVAASSWDQELLDQIAEAYQTIGGLSGFQVTTSSQYSPFVIDESNQPFEVAFRESYDEYQSIDLENINIPELTPCGIIKEKNDDSVIIALGVTEKTKDNFAGGIITYMSKTAETEE